MEATGLKGQEVERNKGIIKGKERTGVERRKDKKKENVERTKWTTTMG
jgi:hypothetical protein